MHWFEPEENLIVASMIVGRHVVIVHRDRGLLASETASDKLLSMSLYKFVFAVSFSVCCVVGKYCGRSIESTKVDESIDLY